MYNSRYWLTKILSFIFLLIALTAECSSPEAKPVGIDRPMFNMDWINEKWTGDDATFKSMKKNMEMNSKAELSKVDWRLKYKKAAQENPNDTMKQFEWGYSYMLYRIHNHTVNTRFFAIQDEVDEIVISLERTKPVNPCYEFDRLRFLISCDVLFPLNEKPKIELGERLLRADPEDNMVLRKMARIYVDSPLKENQKKGLGIALNLEKSSPKNADYQAILAFCFDGIRFYTRKPEDIRRAIEKYNNFLNLIDKDDPDRKIAIKTIERLNNSLNNKPNSP